MDNVRPLRPKPKPKPPRSHPLRRRIITGVIIAVVVVAVIVFLRFLSFYVDWLWFGEVGYRGVFWTTLFGKLIVGVVGAVVFFIIVYPNIDLARRLAPGFAVSDVGDLLEPRSESVKRGVLWGGLAISAVAAVLAGISIAAQWLTYLMALDAAPFGTKDAVFGHDIGFYMFKVPALQSVQQFLFSALLAAFIFSLVVHLIMGGIEYHVTPPAGEAESQSPAGAFGRNVRQQAGIPQFSLKLGGRPVAHLCALLAALFVVTGFGQLLRGWSLLYSTAGAVYGAGYTDVHVQLPFTYVTMALAFLIAAVLVWNMWRRHQWWPLVIVVWIAALIVFRGIIPGVYQSLIVNPNQLSKETPYITNNIVATKAAYGLSSFDQKPFPTKKPLTAADLKANTGTLQNIRLWDPDTLVTSYRQLQELRKYYSFVSAHVDRYTVQGVYRETMISPRELSINGLPAQAQTWVNQHITYTHGYGVAMSAVNQVTSDGSPDFLVQDIPVRSAPGLEVAEPRIYYGELGTGYSLVKTSQPEFDFPGPNGDVYRSYTGTGGIPIGSFFNRLAFSWKFGTIQFLTTTAIKPQSRAIILNDIRARIAAAAPFLQLDADPYMVIADGRLYWIADAYTTTTRYPYSTPEGGLNYIRNSVKVVVDAYNGTMKFYVFDPKDPLLQTYRKIFPSLFTPASQMPRSILAHVRYPQGLFDVQATIYTTYHVDNASLLYNKGDQWAVPDNVSLSGPGPMQPYYVIMKLPGATNAEFLLMLPFVPNGRSNMIAWLGSQSDVPNYGKSVNYVFDKSTTVFGPSQVEATINQDPDISSQRTLWGQQGSRVIMGNLLVVPIESALLYVQPLYLVSSQVAVPQLKRVIVFYRANAPAGQGNAQQVVAMAPTLAEALAKAFGTSLLPGNQSGPSPTGQPGGPTPSPSPTTPGQTGTLSPAARALIAKAAGQFQAAQAALKAGDFAGYGREIKALQQTLRTLQGL